MKTRTVFEHAQPLWQNKTWSIEKISNTEIVITNSNDIAYAYISQDLNTLFVDRLIYPKYVEQIAIKLAAKNIKSIYN